MTERAERILERAGRLKSQRALWDAHWEDLAELLRPVRLGFVGDEADGAKRMEEVYDGTPMQAVRGLAAAIDWMLKNKEEHWFSITPVDDALQDDDEVRGWLEEVERRMYGAMYTAPARFLQATAEVDLDLVVFGTGCLYFDITPRNLRFKAVPLNQVFIAEDDAGRIDTVYRRCRWTARQAAMRFGEDKLSKTIRDALKQDREKDKRFDFWHIVEPRKDRDSRRRELPILSLYIEAESKHEIEEGGFHELPYVVPRWETAADEVYGRSPGMLALPDARTLNEMSRTNLTAAHMAVEPPLFIPNDGSTNAANIYPGGLTGYDPKMAQMLGGRLPIQPLELGNKLNLGLEMENQRRDMIYAAFFRNVLQLPFDAPQMTATEVLERKQEFIRTLGPTFGRLESDYTAPIVERTFNMLLRRNLFPEPPEVLQGRDIRFEYQSPVHKARRMVEAAGLMQTIEQLAPMIQADPSMLDHFDTDAIARDVPEANGVPAKWLRSRDVVEATRRQRVEEQAQTQAMQEMAMGAEVAPKAANALKMLSEAA